MCSCFERFDFLISSFNAIDSHHFNLFIGAASRSAALQHELVQRSMGQFTDHNHEEADGVFTRPTLDLYYVNKYWNFLTNGLSQEEIADLEKAKRQLEHYEKLFTLMEYGSDLNEILTTIETRISSNNPSVPMTIYRQVSRGVKELYRMDAKNFEHIIIIILKSNSLN